jgi:outer membrane biosynthesis protein TonB
LADDNCSSLFVFGYMNPKTKREEQLSSAKDFKVLLLRMVRCESDKEYERLWGEYNKCLLHEPFLPKSHVQKLPVMEFSTTNELMALIHDKDEILDDMEVRMEKMEQKNKEKMEKEHDKEEEKKLLKEKRKEKARIEDEKRQHEREEKIKKQKEQLKEEEEKEKEMEKKSEEEKKENEKDEKDTKSEEEKKEEKERKEEEKEGPQAARFQNDQRHAEGGDSNDADSE